MGALIVSRYKNNFADYQLLFVTKQGKAIAQVASVCCTVLGIRVKR